MKAKVFVALLAILSGSLATEQPKEGAAGRGKSDAAKITKSIRKVRFQSYPEVGSDFDDDIEYILERADNFNILGENEQIDGHFGRFGTRIHIPLNPFIRHLRRLRRRSRAHRAQHPRKLVDAKAVKGHRQAPPTQAVSPKPKKNFVSLSGRVLAAKKKQNPKVKKMFAEIFGKMSKLQTDGPGESRKLVRRHKRKLLLPGAGAPPTNAASASPQINDSRIIVHSFAAPAAAPQSYIKAPYSDTSPHVIQTRMQLH